MKSTMSTSQKESIYYGHTQLPDTQTDGFKVIDSVLSMVCYSNELLDVVTV